MCAGEELFRSNWSIDLDLPLHLPDPRSGLHVVVTCKSLRYFLVLKLSVVIPEDTRKCWNLPTHILLDSQKLSAMGPSFHWEKEMEKSIRIFPWFEEGVFIPYKTVRICRVSCNSLSGFCPSQRGLVEKKKDFSWSLESSHPSQLHEKSCPSLRCAELWWAGKGLCLCRGSWILPSWGVRRLGWTQNLEGWKRRGGKCKYSEIWERRSEIQPKSGGLEEELNTHENQKMCGEERK